MIRSFETPFTVMSIVCATLPDGRPLVAGVGGPLRIWDARTGEMLCDRDDSVGEVIFTQVDGAPILVTGLYDGSVQLCDPATGSVRRTIVAGSGPGVTALAAHRQNDSVWISVGHDDGGLRVIGIDGTTVRQLPGRGAPLVRTTFATSANEVWVIGADAGGTVSIHDVATGELVHMFEPHEGSIMAIAVIPSPDGRPTLVTVGQGPEAVKEWDLADFTQRTALVGAEVGTIGSVGIVNRAGETLVALPIRRGYELWGLVARRRLAHVDVDFSLYEVAFAEVDGRLMLVTEHYDTAVDVWDIWGEGSGATAAESSGPGWEDQSFAAELEEPPFQTGVSYVWSSSFLASPDHPTLLGIGGLNGEYEIWDLDTSRIVVRSAIEDYFSSAYDYFVQAYCLISLTHLEGRPVALIASDISPFTVIDAITGEQLCSIPHEIDLFGLPSSVLGDGRSVVALVGESDVPILEVPSGLQVSAVPSQMPQTHAGLWIPRSDGDPLFMLSSRLDGRVELWEPIRGELLTVFDHPSSIRALAWMRLADGRSCVAAGSQDGRITLWDLERAERIWERETTPALDITYLDFVDVLPGRTVLLVASNSGRYSLWDVATGAMLIESPESGEPPLRMGYLRSGDSLLLVGRSAHDDGTEFIRIRLPSERHVVAGGFSALGPAELTILGDNGSDVHAVAGMQLDDGRLLVVSAGITTGRIQVWDGFSGQLLGSIAHNLSGAWTIELVRMRGGEVGIAVGDDRVTIYDLDGRVVRDLETGADASRATFNSIDFIETPEGIPLLAGAGLYFGVGLWDVETGRLIERLPDDRATAVALSRRPSGDVILAVGDSFGAITLYDVRTMRRLSSFPSGVADVWSVAVTVTSDDRLLVGVVNERGVGIWDGASGTPLHQVDSGDEWSNYVSHTENHELFVVATDLDQRRLLKVVHAATGSVVASIDLPPRGSSQPDKMFAKIVDGNTLVVVVPAGSETYLVKQPLGVEGGAGAGEIAPAEQILPASADALVGLVETGLQPPLSLLQAMTNLIGGRGMPASELAGLIDHPGIVRLRSLDWPHEARAGLAALLIRDLPPDPAFGAPDNSRVELRAALMAALSAGPIPPEAPPTPLALIRAGADRVDPGIVSLLGILGPEAVAADPGLPLRMEQHAGSLPALDLDTRTLLARNIRELVSDSGARAPTPRTTGELAGTSRHGSISNLLRFQLALPTDLFRMQLAQDNLLYRMHVASSDTEPPSIAIVLDTSPATFGPVEAVLRSVGHLLALMVPQVCLVRTDAPGEAQPLVDRTSLLAMWLGRGLDRPDLATAISTAGTCGMEIVVVLTDHHAAREQRLPADARVRLLTAHVAGDPPARRPRTPFHVHLPPAPTPAALVRAAMSLIVPDPPWNGEVRAVRGRVA